MPSARLRMNSGDCDAQFTYAISLPVDSTRINAECKQIVFDRRLALRARLLAGQVWLLSYYRTLNIRHFEDEMAGGAKEGGEPPERPATTASCHDIGQHQASRQVL